MCFRSNEPGTLFWKTRMSKHGIMAIAIPAPANGLCGAHERLARRTCPATLIGSVAHAMRRDIVPISEDVERTALVRGPDLPVPMSLLTVAAFGEAFSRSRSGEAGDSAATRCCHFRCQRQSQWLAGETMLNLTCGTHHDRILESLQRTQAQHR